MNFSLKDNPIFYLGILVSIQQGIVSGTVHLTNMLPAAWIPPVTAWNGFLCFAGTVIMTALAAPGRVPAAAAKLIAWLAVGTVAFALMVAPAHAQQGERGNVRAPQVKLPIPLPKPDPLNLGTGSSAPNSVPGEGPLGQAVANALGAPFKDIAAIINSDIDGAIKLSTQIPSLQDGNGQKCWMAMKQFGDVLKAHPLPLTGRAITDLEAARLLAMAANNLCHVQECTQVFADLSNAVTVATQKIPGAGAVQVPSLNSLCSAVPIVVVAAPASPPASAPAAPQAQ